MVNVGNVKFGAKVEGAAESKAKVAQLQSNFEEMGTTATVAAEQTNELGEQTEEYSEAADDANSQSSLLDIAMNLAGGSARFLATRLWALVPATMSFGTASGYASGAAGTLASVLSGTAGVAGAALVASAGLGYLSSEMLGVTNSTSIANVELQSTQGALADIAYTIHGPVAAAFGFLKNLMTGDFDSAVSEFRRSLEEIGKAQKRYWIRGIAWVRKYISIARYGAEAIAAVFTTSFDRMYNDIVGGLSQIISKYNKVAAEAPGVDGIGGVEFDKRSTAGVQARLQSSYRRHRGRVQSIKRWEQSQLQQNAPQKVNVETNVSVESNGDLSRRELDELARKISERNADELSRRVGGR